ncbi:UDP-N-acetylmuramyl pentapeptide phosphotransferase/UDP-N-acetylglucosamine-1-phosphate transferase [Skermanella aerolata]|uniref:Glycosyl transferase n=1 Tax=Skermanella aerolata TaxID=393310 RepID=A0A512DQK3_9PROT|nr:glycosyltransferase family 4 protein [Skermanella aerolata]KJB93392.1 glycosyl transferase [Skermanella aerolata KACC 11604]GEO38739.1 glycosyl transferase [Skermanella aerolata]
MIDALGLFEVALLAGTAGLSWMATGAVLHYLRRNAILDHPNERSSHKIPTPRGGGWGIMLTLLPAMALIGWIVGHFDHVLPAFAGAVGLMAISWMDDRRSRPAGLRFGMQIAAVAIGLTALPPSALVFQGWLPFWPDRIFAAVGWLWFVNLFNFMDGIDGLAGSEAFSIGIGLAVVAVVANLGYVPLWLALAAAGAALGFLGWNWHPAKVFMGDVGSVPLGFILGWLLLATAASGQWVAAVLVPLYFLADATFTLLRRLFAGKRIWEAHREHIYQRAVQAGHSHSDVVVKVIAANAVLVALAAASAGIGWLALPPGLALVLGLMIWLPRPARRA